MAIARLTVIVLSVVVSLVALLPGIAYSIGLLRVQGRPTPATTANFIAEDIEAAWQRCRDRMPVAVEPMNPWRVAGRFLWGDPRHNKSGEIAAWQIARAHNSEHPVGTMGWWHLSGAALTIWITRHWSAEEIGATLVRDNLCK